MTIFRSQKHRVLLASLLALCMFGVFQAINLPFVSATDNCSSQVSVDLVNGIAIRILNSAATSEIENLNLSIDPVPGGVFTSGNFNVEVSTSNKTGYKLYMNSGTSSTALINQIDSSFTIPSISSAATSSSFTPNTWGYSLDSTNYNPIPANGDPDQVKYTATPSASDLTPVTVGMNVDMSKASGIYSNQLTFTAVAEPVPVDYTLYFEPGTTDTVTGLPQTMTSSEVASSHTFTIPSSVPARTGYNFTGYLDESTSTTYQPGDTITVQGDIDYTGSATLTAQWEIGCAAGANHICFIANEPSGTVSGTMEDQTIVYMTSNTAAGSVDSTALSSSTTELTLYSPNWTLTGYGFKGWNTAADGSDTMYGPNQTITLTADQRAQLGTYGLPIYAQWVASAGDMANWSGCSSLAQDSVTALTYGSDTYAIAKLADGKCWMIENLRYDVNSPDGAGTKTTTFSTSEYNLRQYNVTNIDGEDGAYPINLTSPAGASSTTNQYQWKSYGGYYSWASAIKTTATSSDQYYNWDGTSYSSSTSATTQGICPSGWRIPRAYAGNSADNEQSDFRNLNNEINGSYGTTSTAEGSNNWRKYPNNFVFAGVWNGTSSSYRGTYGRYWSSTVLDSSIAYNLSFNSTAVNPASDYLKYRGLSVRCVIGS